MNAADYPLAPNADDEGLADAIAQYHRDREMLVRASEAARARALECSSNHEAPRRAAAKEKTMSSAVSNVALAGPKTSSESGIILKDGPGVTGAGGGTFSVWPMVSTLPSVNPLACINVSTLMPYV